MITCNTHFEKQNYCGGLVGSAWGQVLGGRIQVWNLWQVEWELCRRANRVRQITREETRAGRAEPFPLLGLVAVVQEHRFIVEKCTLCENSVQPSRGPGLAIPVRSPLLMVILSLCALFFPFLLKPYLLASCLVIAQQLGQPSDT